MHCQGFGSPTSRPRISSRVRRFIVSKAHVPGLLANNGGGSGRVGSLGATESAIAVEHDKKKIR